VVLHQPLAAGPCGHFSGWGLKGGLDPPGRDLEKGPPGGPGTLRDRGSRLRPGRGRRAPARGVDVKPPPSVAPGPVPEPGIRDPEIWGLPGPLGGKVRDPGSGDLRDQGPGDCSRTGPGGLPGPLRPLGAPRPPRRGLFYINPSRRGPVPGRRVPGTPRRVESLLAAAGLEHEGSGLELYCAGGLFFSS